MKNVVITGVSGGLGRCLAEEYLREGCNVFGYDIEERDIKTYLGADGKRFYFEYMDVGNDISVENSAEELGKKVSGVDILINCAGILPSDSAKVLEDFDVSGSLETFNVNALGPLRMTKAFLALLKKAEAGVIVNISSEAGSLQTHAGYIIRYDYCMSKAALNIQSVILQRYLEQEKIRVLTVHPGWMKTSMGGENAPILPRETAKGIKDLVNCHQYDYHNRVFMDYNNKIRPW